MGCSLFPTVAEIITFNFSINFNSIRIFSLFVSGTAGSVFTKRSIIVLPNSSVIHLVEQAQTQALPSQKFIDRFEKGYAKVIVIAGILLATLPLNF